VALYLTQQKTTKPVEIPLVTVAMNILKRYDYKFRTPDPHG
jgi:hypothetical protein